MKFSCPHCGQHISASPELSGTEATCPGCSAMFLVPAFQEQPRSRRLASTKRPSAEHIPVIWIVRICVLVGFLSVWAIYGDQMTRQTDLISALGGAFIIFFGTKGFSQHGLPLTTTRNITGGFAYLIGLVVILIGAVIFFLSGLMRAASNFW